ISEEGFPADPSDTLLPHNRNMSGIPGLRFSGPFYLPDQEFYHTHLKYVSALPVSVLSSRRIPPFLSVPRMSLLPHLSLSRNHTFLRLYSHCLQVHMLLSVFV